MNPSSIEKSSEIACNFVVTLLSLALVAGYVCLYHVFQSDRQEGRAAAMEQQIVAPEAEQLTYQGPE